MKNYTKHLVECHCILKIFENKTKPLYHKFPVFSLVDENDVIEEKYVMCNNCDIIHRVHDICKSEIKWGKEGYKSLVYTKEDIKFNLENNGNEKIAELLEINQVDISDWELVDYLIENNLEGHVILDKKEMDDNVNYKVLYILKEGKIKIKNELDQRYV
tara:strand:+ start:8564 stop:9040 length:477 start_codon:yes stop_codon:yes gene_type:complete